MLIIAVLVLAAFMVPADAAAQCSICTRTAEQMGEKPAEGLNAGILYLAFMPLAIIGFLAYRWWRREKQIGVA
ncbi:MAG TPA: hypothetical protein VHK69_21195 [Chitinophagaceae bacterium]|nr:hypothetical protein [Chitinophagaceae bacterium]